MQGVFKESLTQWALCGHNAVSDRLKIKFGLLGRPILYRYLIGKWAADPCLTASHVPPPLSGLHTDHHLSFMYGSTDLYTRPTPGGTPIMA